MSSLEEQLAAASGNLDAATQTLAAFYNTEKAKVDGIAAQYNALAANLKGVIKSELSFAADWRPSQPNNPVNGGSFQSLYSLINAAPNGAYVLVKMYADEQYVLDEGIFVINKHVRLLGQNGTSEVNRPSLDCPSADSGNYTSFVGQFHLYGSASIRFENINILLDAKKASPWSNQRSIVNPYATAGGSYAASMRNVKVSGSDGSAVVRTHVGGIVNFSSYLLELDGDISACYGLSGILLISNYALTLTNGAVAQVGNTLGTNLLQY